MGATFSLSGLRRQGEEPSYLVTDGDIPCTISVEKNYTYLFNICAAVSGVVPKKCASIGAAALQIDTRDTLEEGDDYVSALSGASYRDVK
jgi:hypothetical protein